MSVLPTCESMAERLGIINPDIEFGDSFVWAPLLEIRNDPEMLQAFERVLSHVESGARELHVQPGDEYEAIQRMGHHVANLEFHGWQPKPGRADYSLRIIIDFPLPRYAMVSRPTGAV